MEVKVKTLGEGEFSALHLEEKPPPCHKVRVF